jgi:hypothetical protein
VADVVFAIGNRPGVSRDEALELAELLSQRRTLAALRLAARIRIEASRDPDRPSTREDIDLDEMEAPELLVVLAEQHAEVETESLGRLRAELLEHLSKPA